MNISIKKTSKILVINEFRVPLVGMKNKMLEINTREKYMLQERRQKWTETDMGSYYDQEEWL